MAEQRTKIIDENNIEFDGVRYGLMELQRKVDMKATGANIHTLRNAIALIGGNVNLYMDKGEMTVESLDKYVELIIKL